MVHGHFQYGSLSWDIDITEIVSGNSLMTEEVVEAEAVVVLAEAVGGTQIDMVFVCLLFVFVFF